MRIWERGERRDGSSDGYTVHIHFVSNNKTFCLYFMSH